MTEMTPEERLKQIWKLYQQLADTKGEEYERTWQEFSAAICDIPRMLAVRAARQEGVDRG